MALPAQCTIGSLGARACAVIALLLATSTLVAEDIWTDEEVDAYFARTWDWRTLDRNEFTTYWGHPIQPPWEIDAAVGIPVGGTNVPDPRRGWRLYEKHLNCGDYGQATAPCRPEEEGVSVLFPHFSLYNIYTGTLRVFIWPFLPAGSGDDIRYTISSDIVIGAGSSALHDAGLFLHKGEFGVPLVNKRASVNKSYSTVLLAYPRWLVIDRQLSYDPSDLPPDVGITFRTHGIREGLITTHGTLTESLDAASEQPPDEPFSSLEFLGSAYDAARSAVKLVDSNLKLAEDLDKRSDKLREDHPKLSDAVGHAADLVKIPGTVIAAAVGVVDIVSAFANLFGAPAVRYTPQTFQVKLESDITGERALDLFKLGVHGSTQLTEPGYTPILEHEGRLGLYSLARAPVFETGDDYVRLLDKDLRTLVVVNPHSRMVLVEAKAQPIVSVPPTMEWHSTWSIDNPRYDQKSKEIPGLVEDGLGLSKVVTTPGFEAPAILDFHWDPRGGVRVDDPPRGVQDNSTTRRIRLKLYLKFQHREAAHSDIVAEFVETYDTVLRARPCSEGPARDRDTWYVKDPDSWTSYVLTSEISQYGQYTHRPCSLPWEHAVLFRHTGYRGVRNVRHHPEHRVGRLVLSSNKTRLAGTAVGDKSVSSLMVAPFTAITLYDEPGFRGESITFTENAPRLSLLNWNDKARSVRVRNTAAWVPILH